MKELENGKKKLLITGMILIIIAVCAAGIFAYGSHKNNQKAAAKVQEESVQRASQEQSLAAQKEQEQEARSIAEAELQKALSEAQSRDESIAASEAESREQAQKEAEEASIAQEKAEQEAREEQERQAQGGQDQGHIKADLCFSKICLPYFCDGPDDAFSGNDHNIGSDLDGDAKGQDRAAQQQA